MSDDVTVPIAAESQVPIVVYWRPGCGFCWALERQMSRSGLVYERTNIWDEPEAAAFVRSVTGGSETVPTVTVGSESMVNPSLADIHQALAGQLSDG